MESSGSAEQADKREVSETISCCNCSDAGSRDLFSGGEEGGVGSCCGEASALSSSIDILLIFGGLGEDGAEFAGFFWLCIFKAVNVRDDKFWHNGWREVFISIMWR